MIDSTQTFEQRMSMRSAVHVAISKAIAMKIDVADVLRSRLGPMHPHLSMLTKATGSPAPVATGARR